MEEELLQGGERIGESIWELFVEELKKVSYIAAPMVVVTVAQILPRVVSMMMVGHLGELALSGTAVAISLTNVTGFSIVFGMASALETLCGQAFGAEQYEKLGIYTYSSIICLLMVCLPISLLWIFMEKMLIFMGQDPSISAEAGRYAIWIIPALFSYALLQPLIRYLQTQSLIFPMLWSSVTALIFHILACWALVYKLKLGVAGASLSISLSYWFNVILILLYVKYSSACKKTSSLFSKALLPSMKEFSQFAFPSAVMVCLPLTPLFQQKCHTSCRESGIGSLEWWSCEILVLLAGLLPNPQLETSVISTCFLVASLHYFIPYSVGAAASTRVSNELGAGCPEKAQASVWAANFLATTEAVIACTILLCCRNFLGYAVSNEEEVVNYLGEMTPFLCLLLAMDSVQSVLSGVARGSGWQYLGAYVNLGAFYVVGLPTALVLGFVLKLRGKGLWLGLNMGSIMQAVLLTLVTCSMNWRKQASMARERVFEGTMAAADGKSLT